MSVAAYDNPKTMKRELWKDKKIICSMSINMIYAVGFEGDKGIHFGIHGEPWQDGCIIGDKDAIAPQTTTKGEWI